MPNKRTPEEAGLAIARARRAPAPEPRAEPSPTPSEVSESPVHDARDVAQMGAPDSELVEHRTVEELQEEVECLENVVERLAQEKHGLKMRLNQMDYFQQFSIGDCKKWLASNFEFDRKDTPELLAGIFENYLMQNDELEPLPHQLIVKNSSRAQAKRERSVYSRSYQNLRKPKEKLLLPDPKPKRAFRPPPEDSKPNDPGAYGQYLYMSPFAIDELYATKPWVPFIERWPKLRVATKSANADALAQFQETFLKKNAAAIWERTHWFPIKMENGKTAEEIKLLGRHHNRRKRRQAQLKEQLEHLSIELKNEYERPLLEQSIFGSRWVTTLLKRPSMWLPREDESLVEQLRELDEAEPERSYHFP